MTEKKVPMKFEAMRKVITGIKIEKSISLGAILQSLVLAIAAIVLVGEFNETQENTIFIANRVVSTLDDLDTYLSNIDETNEDMETILTSIEDHLDQIKDSIGKKSYSDDNLVESINKIRKEID